MTEQVILGTNLPELIFVTDNKNLVVLEGHTRITAYFMAYLKGYREVLAKDFEVIVGYSENLSQWRYYPKSVNKAKPRRALSATPVI